MRKQIGSKKLSLILLAVLILMIAGLTARDEYLAKQRLLAEGIYMFQDTYMFTTNPYGELKTIYAYYMVCEPADDKVRLVEKLERLMEEKQVVRQVRDFYREKLGQKYGYDDLDISVEFYKPSKEFPIGWQPLELYSMEDYDIYKNVVVTINIPWSAETQDEHTYYFWRPLGSGTMTHDVFTRQTQADGSFILIPKS